MFLVHEYGASWFRCFHTHSPSALHSDVLEQFPLLTRPCKASLWRKRRSSMNTDPGGHSVSPFRMPFKAAANSLLISLCVSCCLVQCHVHGTCFPCIEWPRNSKLIQAPDTYHLKPLHLSIQQNMMCSVCCVASYVCKLGERTVITQASGVVAGFTTRRLQHNSERTSALRRWSWDVWLAHRLRLQAEVRCGRR